MRIKTLIATKGFNHNALLMLLYTKSRPSHRPDSPTRCNQEILKVPANIINISKSQYITSHRISSHCGDGALLFVCQLALQQLQPGWLTEVSLACLPSPGMVTLDETTFQLSTTTSVTAVLEARITPKRELNVNAT